MVRAGTPASDSTCPQHASVAEWPMYALSAVYVTTSSKSTRWSPVRQNRLPAIMPRSRSISNTLASTLRSDPKSRVRTTRIQWRCVAHLAAHTDDVGEETINHRADTFGFLGEQAIDQRGHVRQRRGRRQVEPVPQPAHQEQEERHGGQQNVECDAARQEEMLSSALLSHTRCA